MCSYTSNRLTRFEQVTNRAQSSAISFVSMRPRLQDVQVQVIKFTVLIEFCLQGPGSAYY